MLELKSAPINKKNLIELINILEADLPKLQNDESYQSHEPAYYNYVIYYEDLADALLQLAGKDKICLFGTYLVGLLAYQVIDCKTPLHMAVYMILDELKLKYEELTGIAKEEAEDDAPSKYQA